MSGFIRNNIDELDQYHKDLQIDPEDDSIEESTSHPVSGFDDTEYARLRVLGSPLKACTFLEIEAAHRTDIAFKDIRIKLGKFMTMFLPAYNIPLPGDKEYVHFRPTDTVRGPCKSINTSNCC